MRTVSLKDLILAVHFLSDERNYACVRHAEESYDAAAPWTAASGKPCSMKQRGRAKGLSIPKCAGRRGGLVGEGGGVEVFWLSTNFLPERSPTAVVVGRGRRCRSRQGKHITPCQNGAQDNLEMTGNKEEAWRGPQRLEVQLLADGNGGEARMIVAAWGRFLCGGGGGNERGCAGLLIAAQKEGDRGLNHPIDGWDRRVVSCLVCARG